MSLWYLAKAVSSFDCMMAVCFWTSRVPLPKPPPGARRRRSLEACWTSPGTSQRRPVQTTHIRWVLNAKGLTTQGL
jgi:hypothetical protein